MSQDNTASGARSGRDPVRIRAVCGLPVDTWARGAGWQTGAVGREADARV